MWLQLIEGYLTAMRAAGRRPKTVRLHAHYLAGLSRQWDDPLTVTRRELEQWLANGQWGPESRKSARTVAVMFYRWCVSMGKVEKSPAADLLPITVPAGVPRPAPQDIYEQALVGAATPVRLMLMLARHAGLRCGEIAAVRSADLVGDMLYVDGKGGKIRLVPILNVELQRAIASAGGYLFPGAIDGHMSAQWVSKVMGRQLPGRWTAHQLRHAFATRAYAANPDVLALGKVLGHSKPETTMRYVETPGDALRLVVESAA